MNLTVKPKKKQLLDKFSGYVFSWNFYRVNPRPSVRINFVYEKYVFIKRKHSFFALLLSCIYTMLYMLIKRLYIYIYFFFDPTLIDNKCCWFFVFLYFLCIYMYSNCINLTHVNMFLYIHCAFAIVIVFVPIKYLYLKNNHRILLKCNFCTNFIIFVLRKIEMHCLTQ